MKTVWNERELRSIMAQARRQAAPAHDDDPHFEVVDITPEQATKWLEKNHNNRNISQATVTAFVKVMKMGGWRVNNQAIAFDTEGRLIDGQHRLWAIVESGLTVRISVAYDVAPEAIKTIDRGRTRSVAEVLRREGSVPSPKRVGAWCNGEKQLLTNRPAKGSVEETEEYYRKHKKAVDFVLETLPDKSPFKAAMIGATLVFAHKKNTVFVEDFVRRMVAGSGLEETSPIFVCRELIIAAGGNAKNQRRPLALKILRTIQAEFRNEALKRTHVYATESSLHFFQGK